MKQVLRQFVLLFLLFGLAPLARGQETNAVSSRDMAAMAQETPSLAAFLKKSRAQQAPESWVLEVLRESKRLHDRGLPIEPYLLKANEGLAKGIAPEKILPALHTTRSQTEWAGSLVNRAERQGFGPSGPEERRVAILRVQNALKNDIPPQSLESTMLDREKTMGAQRSLESWSEESRSLLPSRVPWLPGSGKSPPPGLSNPVVNQALPETHVPAQNHLEKEPPHGPPKFEKDLEKGHGRWKKHEDESEHHQHSSQSFEKEKKEKGWSHGNDKEKHGKHGKD